MTGGLSKMSMRQVPAAKLAGWEGPFYQAAINQLAEAMDGCGQQFDGVALSKIGGRVKGFVSRERLPRAADGYAWFWCLIFRVGFRKQVLVAIPWAQDWDRHDGTAFDRSPAIYLKGRVTGAEADAVVTSLASQVKALGR
jgi:hypothetical protein